jgi:hypothetical protein
MLLPTIKNHELSGDIAVRKLLAPMVIFLGFIAMAPGLLITAQCAYPFHKNPQETTTIVIDTKRGFWVGNFTLLAGVLCMSLGAAFALIDKKEK